MSNTHDPKAWQGIALPLAELVKLTLATSTDETRQSLNCVLVEPSGVMVATDGHILAQYTPKQFEPVKAGQLLIHRDDILKAKKMAPKLSKHSTGFLAMVLIGQNWEVRTIEIDSFVSHGGFLATVVDTFYPNYKQVIPHYDATTAPIRSIGLNPNLLAIVGQIAGNLVGFTFGSETVSPILWQDYSNGGNSWSRKAVCTPGRWSGVLMPCHLNITESQEKTNANGLGYKTLPTMKEINDSYRPIGQRA